MIPNIRAPRPVDGADPDLLSLELWRAFPKAGGEIGTLPVWDVDLTGLVHEGDLEAIEQTFPGAAAMVRAGQKSDAYKEDRVAKTRVADVELHIRAAGDPDSEVMPVDLVVKAAVRHVKLSIRGDVARLTWRLRVSGSARELGPLVDHLKREVEANFYSYNPQMFGEHGPGVTSDAVEGGIVPIAGSVIVATVDGVNYVGEVKAVTHPRDASEPVVATLKPLSGTPLQVEQAQVDSCVLVDWGELDKVETLRSFVGRCKRDGATPDWGYLLQAITALLSEGEQLLSEDSDGAVKITAEVIERAVTLAKLDAAKVAK